MAVFDLDRTPIEIQSTKTDQDQKLPLGRLQTPREWNDRVPIEEYYSFNVAIPLKVEFEKKSRTTTTTCTWKMIYRKNRFRTFFLKKSR